MIKLILINLLVHIIYSTKLLLQRVSSPNCVVYGNNNQSTIQLQNCDNNQYITTVGLGTPAQNFTVLIDSGSNILWIPVIGCTGGCGKQFNLNNSSTANPGTQQMSLQYADGSGVSGTYGSDMVQFYGTNINVNSGILWVTTENSASLPSNGLMGLGFDSTYNVFDNAYTAGQISTNAFMLKLELNVFASSLYFDTFPQALQQSTVFVPQYKTGHWQVNTIGFYADSIDMTNSASSISIIDSGTSIFYFNDALYQQIYQTYFSSCTPTTNYISCSCNTHFPTFTFYFETIQTYIYAQNYTTNLFGSCLANFGTLGDVNNILLGDTFFRNYAITFQKNLKNLANSQIGFSGDMGLISLIGSDSTYFFYIGQIVCTGLAGLLLIFSIIVFFTIHSTQREARKQASKTINKFLIQM